MRVCERLCPTVTTDAPIEHNSTLKALSFFASLEPAAALRRGEPYAVMIIHNHCKPQHPGFHFNPSVHNHNDGVTT